MKDFRLIRSYKIQEDRWTEARWSNHPDDWDWYYGRLYSGPTLYKCPRCGYEDAWENGAFVMQPHSGERLCEGCDMEIHDNQKMIDDPDQLSLPF